MGLSEGRLSFIIDKKGVVRYVAVNNLKSIYIHVIFSDVMDSVLNYNGHVKFALKAIKELQAEESKGANSEPTPTATAPAAEPTPAPTASS
jgi:hypothetical protein